MKLKPRRSDLVKYLEAHNLKKKNGRRLRVALFFITKQGVAEVFAITSHHKK